MGPIGIPELFAVLAILAFAGIPIYAAVWLLRTAARIVRIQEETLDCLKFIDRRLGGRTVE